MTFNDDAARRWLTPKQTLSSLLKGFAGTNFTSEVLVSPDGTFMYAASRLHESIAFFSIGGEGVLTFAGEEWTRGDYPGSFTTCARCGAKIVSLPSVHGYFVEPGCAVYCGTQAAIIWLTKTVAIRRGEDGIRVNCICPGYIDAGLSEGYFQA